MEIVYLGHAAFLLKTTKVRVVCDPVGDAVGFKQKKVAADIVTISHDHFDHNKLDAVEGEPMVINGPGEYEIHGVSVLGVSSFHDDAEGKKRGKNTIYTIDIEGLRVCHLGDLGHQLSDSQLTALDGVDVLLVPVGGEFTIDAKQAWEVVKKVNPSIVIPMHYKTAEHKKDFAKLSSVDDFIAASGLEPKKQDKLTVKKAELPEELELVVLSRYGR